MSDDATESKPAESSVEEAPAAEASAEKSPAVSEGASSETPAIEGVSTEAPSAVATVPDEVDELDEDDEYDDEDGDDEDGDDEDDEDEAASTEAKPAKGVSLAQLLGVSAISLTIGAMIAGGVVGVIASADAPRPSREVARLAAPPVDSTLTAALAAPPRSEAGAVPAAVDAAVEAAVDASADGATVVQETDPEDVGDGVMDDLDDAPQPRRPSRSSTRRAAVTPSVGSTPPTRGSSRVVTSDNIPEGPAQGYVDGRPVRIEVTRLDGKPVERHTAAAYRRMYAAAEHDHVILHIVSGFRTMEHQQALYRAYQRGQGNLAAVPGHSNHQSGHALDLNTRAPGVLRWLERNGRRFGFRRTVPTEPWHWEWW